MGHGILHQGLLTSRCRVMIQIGETLPPFSQAASTGTLTNEDFKGQLTVLFFYPRDNTPGCTQEGQDFRDNHQDFLDLGAKIIGISRDNLKSHQKFIDKFEFTFPLISDEDESICDIFQVVKDKNMYGKKVRGIERSTFIFDKNAKLIHEWRKVKVPGHVDEVLATIKTLV